MRNQKSGVYEVLILSLLLIYRVKSQNHCYIILLMEQKNLYPTLGDSKRTAGARIDALKRTMLASGLFCMLLTMFAANNAHAQAATRSSTVYAGGSSSQDSLWTFSLPSGSIVKRLHVTYPGFTVAGVKAIATDPTTNQHYCVLDVTGLPTNILGKINIQTGICSFVASLPHDFMTLAFTPNGSLFGVTADFVAPAETMFRINKSTGAVTPFRALGAGGFGESITYNYDDNKFYHWSGFAPVVWQRFDTTGMDVIETISYTGSTGFENHGAMYYGPNELLSASSTNRINRWNTTTNAITQFSFTTPAPLHGLVKETHSSLIDPAGPTTICPGATVTLEVTGGTGGYQWFYNGSPITGANSATYAADAAGVYNCIYADVNGIIDSPATGITVKMYSMPSISVAAHPAVCQGVTSTGFSFSTLTSHNYTGAPTTYIVPQGVTSVHFDLAGGVGGVDSGIAPNPGRGGRLQGTLAVTAGDILTVNVGGAGNAGSLFGAIGGFNGGGNSWGFGGSGGGATDIRLNGGLLVQRVAVAGGGAGSGHDGVNMSVLGGFGGGTTAGDGEFNAEGSKATGGSATAGGTGAAFTGFANGEDGQLGQGGAGSIDGVSGGGGGGYFGGGGGVWSGGGGGSSYADGVLATSVVHTPAYNVSAGFAKISFDVPTAYTYSIDWDPTAEGAGFTDVTTTAFPTSSAFPVTVPAGAAPAVYNGFLTINDGTCSYVQPVSVEVKAIPTVDPTADQSPVCNGTNTNTVAFTGSHSSTNYNWTNSLATVGIPTSGTGDIFAFTAFNASAANQVAEIIVTPELNGCYGTPDTFTYTVKPTPTLTGGSSAGFVCDNSLFAYTATSPVSGTTFAWSRPALTGDITAAAATGAASISETFDNTGNLVVPVTYTYTLTANGCVNNQFLTVSVNPTPSLFPTPLVGSSCSGNAVTFTQTSLTPGLVHSWSRAAVTGITPGAASGAGLINEVLTNTTVAPITVVYVDTMNINGCKYTENLSVVVNPMPVLTSSLTGNICDNASFNYKAKTGTAGTTISWERYPVSGITSAYASGTDTIAETHDNITLSPIVVTYNFSLSANGCTNFQDVLLTVNPTPSLSTTLTPAAICDSTTFNYTPNSLTPGAVFTWSRATVTGITNPAATGTGNPAERLRNATPLPVVVTYVYTTSVNGCGTSENVVVTVNPRPRLSNTMPAPICDSTVFNLTPASFTPGYTYTWSRPFVAGIGSVPVMNATGNISELLKNNTNGNLAVIYEFTLNANGCTNQYNVPVVVHPTPKMSSSLTDSACSGAPFVYEPTTDLTVPVTYAWARAAVGNITPNVGNGTGNVNETLVNGTAATINVAYVYTITVGASCSKSQTVTVKVRPSAEAPVISTMPGSSLCNGAMYQNFGASVPAPTGVTYSWSATNAEVYATGTGNQYSLVNFNTPGNAVVTLSAAYTSTGCVGVATYSVAVGSTVNTMPVVIYTRGKFICLQNNVKTYQWGYDDAATLDSVALKGEVNQSYFDAAPKWTQRNYWVMTNNGECTIKAYFNKPNDNTPKVEAYIEEEVAGMKLFPNPAADQVNVELTTVTNGEVRVELVNMLGQVLNKVNTDNNKATFNVAELPAGFYMVECYQDGVRIGTAKFVKN